MAKVDIRARVDAFVNELETLIRDSIREGFAQAMGDASIVKRGPGRPPGPSRAAASPAPALHTGKRKKGQKRSPAELQRIEETLAAFIQKTPGKRIEEINKALGTSTSDLSRPLSKLIAAKKVRRQGQKRASRYFPTGK
jgi:hypothetical protein